jgi:thioredoxin 1
VAYAALEFDHQSFSIFVCWKDAAMKELTDLTFDAFVAQPGYVCLDFYAGFCAPCKKLAEVLERLQMKFSNIKFASLNVEECMEASMEFSIRAVPTLVLFKDGQKVDSIEGMLPEAKLIERLEKLRGV